MPWLFLLLEVAALIGLVVLAWRWRHQAARDDLSEEEAAAEAVLTTSVELLLRELQESAQRTAQRLTEQTTTLEALLTEAEARASALPATEDRAPWVRPRAQSAWADRAQELAQRGLSLPAIARAIGRGEGEVRLALATGAGLGAADPAGGSLAAVATIVEGS